MTITHKLSIDLARREHPVRVDAVQDDCGRVLSLALYTNGIPWTVPVGVSAIVRYCKADGIGGEYDTLPDDTCAWSVSGNVLSVSLAPQVLTVAGEVALSVLLTNGAESISTFDICLQVHPGVSGRVCKSDTYVKVSSPADALADIGSRIIRGDFSSIVLLGDSITDGAGGSEYNGSYTSDISTNTNGYCWANVFKKFVEERYGISVRNLGLYGTPMVTQMEAVLKHITNKDLVIWLTGTNDRDGSGSYQANLKSCIHAIKIKCAGVLVISNIPATKADEDDHAVNMQKMDEIVRTVTNGYVPYISMYQEFNRYCDIHSVNPADCFADHVHPNDLGYYIIFKALCSKLGLPLDTYTDYRSNGLWWRIRNGEKLLLDSTDDYSGTANDSMGLAEFIVPAPLMTRYDSNAHTTAVSGKYITRALLRVNKTGQITIGKVDLNTVGQTPVYIESKTFNVTETGDEVEFLLDMALGENETLAFQRTSDTGQLGYIVISGDLFFWQAKDFAAGAYSVDLMLWGKLYGV